ncbi:5064_t:CDS:2 [Scutellospora calospora]|uniref:5064_t:CDS:1 n=1 Tax=Scutellospora calospora TaxID=85575 RepID=A0ACA9KC61_9GLOM|nr:5064_t:CDS:2 [Scutellospora calospora]
MDNKQILKKLNEIKKILDSCNRNKINEALDWEPYKDAAEKLVKEIIEKRELAEEITYYQSQGNKEKNDFDIFFKRSY